MRLRPRVIGAECPCRSSAAASPMSDMAAGEPEEVCPEDPIQDHMPWSTSSVSRIVCTSRTCPKHTLCQLATLRHVLFSFPLSRSLTLAFPLSHPLTVIPSHGATRAPLFPSFPRARALSLWVTLSQLDGPDQRHKVLVYLCACKTKNLLYTYETLLYTHLRERVFYWYSIQ